MKKKSILLGALAIGCVFALASCSNPSGPTTGSLATNTATTKPSTSPSADATTKPSVTSPSEAASEETIQLGVTVVYPDGTPLVGKRVQWCDTTGNCYTTLPKTDENGYASASFKSNLKYYAHIFDIPEGYTFNPFELKQDKNNLNGTLHLIPIEYSETGEGTIENPYVAKLGYNVLGYTKKDSRVYYSINFSEAGTYYFESFSLTGDTTLGYLANDINSRAKSVSSGGNDKNFKYSITVTEEDLSKTFYFLVMSDNTENLLFSITK